MDASVNQSQRERIFDAAVTIGRQLCEAAIVDAGGRHANWMGRRDITEDSLLAQYSVRAAALGPDVYAGGAGVALFLAELYRQTAEPAFAATAAAALRRSVRYLQTHDLPLHPYSFFAGHAGILAVALRLRTAAPHADLDAVCDWLKREIARADSLPASPDIIAGCAGAVLALTDVAAQTGDAAMLEAARACGDALCTRAQWTEDSCAWVPHSAGGDRQSPPMAGVAHGAAGMALALMALYRHAPQENYLDTVRGGLAFTDRLFDEREGNWIDTRMEHRRADDGRLTGTFQTAWCHGAAGIMLTRLQAAEIDPPQAARHLRFAEHAAAAVVRGLKAKLAQRQGDATLCHGIFGLNEALASYARTVGDSERETTALETAVTLLSRYRALNDWPSGINAGGPSPSLMVGAAGIGYHLLRLAARGPVPPILTLFA
ncbi:MAG TPA: lanthionine synthetase LanC family protein [Pseudolabrys sp.]|nr:lanthionine synthetase LanC family protein [Pseudolabrys sp.]